MSTYIDEQIDEMVQQVEDINKDLESPFKSASMSTTFAYTQVPGMQVKITVGYDLEEE